jgi:hypothetical protein
MKMLAHDREKRFPRAETVARDLEQKIPLREGIRPTNNSLQAYLEIFDGQFKEIAPEQLQQLPFLHGELKRPALRRLLHARRQGLPGRSPQPLIVLLPALPPPSWALRLDH